MASMRDIKQRITNVRSTEQIIKAMDMIASTKLHKVRAQLEGVRPMYNELKRLAHELGNHEEAKSHIFYKGREVKSSLYIVVTSDRGFAGGYNANIKAKVLDHMNQGKNEKILVVGAKGKDYFRKKKKNVIRSIIDVADSQMYYGTESVAKWATDLYLTGQVDEVFVAFTDFESIMSYIPRVEKLLPITTGKEEDLVENDRKYEPDMESFIDHMIPLYLHMYLFWALSESHTSEQAARMVNMDAAGKNAEEIIEDLNRLYNRKRQAAITQELSEIVGGASMMNKGGGKHDS